MAVLPRFAVASALLPVALAASTIGIAISLTGCAKAMSDPQPGPGPRTAAEPAAAHARSSSLARLSHVTHDSIAFLSETTDVGNRPMTQNMIRSPFFGAEGASTLRNVDELLPEGARPLEKNGLCPPDMASIDDLYCIDRFEASLFEIKADGQESPWPYYLPTEGHVVRAVSEKGALPQGYISEKQAIVACGRSGKRLCKPAEWRKACRGPEVKKFGYGDADEPKRCNNYGVSPVTRLWGAEMGEQGNWDYRRMNAPELNQMTQTIAKTGDHEGCTNGYGVYDMVGNLHEWVDDPEGTFIGGYFQDTHLNGDGCSYTSDAHAAYYHDYSTGFRCCADVDQ